MIKVNVGCGATPTPGFVNLDNSWSARLTKWSLFGTALSALPLLGNGQRTFMARARELGIQWAEASALPFASGTVAVVYSSHMLEHLSREEADRFFGEVSRVLQPGGWVRIAVPDLKRIARQYVSGEFDADQFVESTLMAWERPRGLLGRVKMAVAGPRHHLWMYDGHSLSRRLEAHGLVDVVEVSPGRTNISDPGSLNLSERADESVYIEARKPI